MIGKLVRLAKKIVGMKISEVINKLQEIQKEHGDLKVQAVGDNSFYYGLADESFILCGSRIFIKGCYGLY